jgi:hypothetical protein
MKCKDGKERQALYDAIKRIREEGEAWLTIDGRRLRALDPRIVLAAYGELGVIAPQYGECLVRSRCARFGIGLAEFSVKDAWPRVRVDELGGRVCRRTAFAELLGIICESHPRLSSTPHVVRRRTT